MDLWCCVGAPINPPMYVCKFLSGCTFLFITLVPLFDFRSELRGSVRHTICVDHAFIIQWKNGGSAHKIRRRERKKKIIYISVQFLMMIPWQWQQTTKYDRHHIIRAEHRTYRAYIINVVKCYLSLNTFTLFLPLNQPKQQQTATASQCKRNNHNLPIESALPSI